MARKLSVMLDDATDDVLRRVAPHGDAGAYIRASILEKAARDEGRAEVDALREQQADHERRIAALEAERDRPPLS